MVHGIARLDPLYDVAEQKIVQWPYVGMKTGLPAGLTVPALYTNYRLTYCESQRIHFHQHADASMVMSHVCPSPATVLIVFN